MLAIKFRNRIHVDVKTKIEIINSVFDIIAVNKREKLFYSDYTFTEVEESTVIPLFEDLFKQDVLDDLNNNHFITFIAEAPYGSIRAEINPNKVRNNVSNCSHIDINIQDEISLYDIVKKMNKIEHLVNYFDTRRDIISEFYFFDLSKSPDCYTDLYNRVFTKEYDEFEYASLLLKGHKFEDKVDEKTTKAIACNFTHQLFQESRQPFVQGIITDYNLSIAAASGSLMVEGRDMSEFMELMLINMKKYIASIKGKDVYNIEFDNLYRR